MSDTFSQTAKGKAELAVKPGKLSIGLKTLLGMVGEKSTAADLRVKLPQVPVEKLMAALDRLVADGYLQRATPPAPTARVAPAARAVPAAPAPAAPAPAAPAARAVPAAPAPAAPAAPAARAVPAAPAPAAPAARAVPAAPAPAAPAARAARAVPAAPVDNDLDFTRFISRPVKEPTLQQKRQAEATLAGFRISKTAGFHVSIINRPAQRVAPNAGGDKHTVLIIDADDANALVMTRALLLANFDTRTAGKCDEIIGELNKTPPADVIAMDTALPDVGGLELLGRMREHPSYKAIPIIVMAVTNERDDVVAALAYGASGYMSKPFRPEALLASVRTVLGL